MGFSLFVLLAITIVAGKFSFSAAGVNVAFIFINIVFGVYLVLAFFIFIGVYFLYYDPNRRYRELYPKIIDEINYDDNKGIT